MQSHLTENFQNYETVNGACIPNTYKFKTQIDNKLRWFASDINFKLLHTGCPIAHVYTRIPYPSISGVSLDRHLTQNHILSRIKGRQKSSPNNVFVWSYCSWDIRPSLHWMDNKISSNQ